MSPTISNSRWAQRLDWWERILSVAAIPMIAALATWANNVEDRIANNGQAIAILQQQMAHQDEDRAEIITRLAEVAARQIEVIQRLSKIEALVTK